MGGLAVFRPENVRWDETSLDNAGRNAMSSRELRAERFVVKFMKTPAPLMFPFLDLELKDDRLHIKRSIDLIRKSQEGNDIVQERIHRSLALIERSRVNLTGGRISYLPNSETDDASPTD